MKSTSEPGAKRALFRDKGVNFPRRSKNRNVYAADSIKPVEIKREIYKSIVIIGDVNTPHSVINRTVDRKAVKTGKLKNGNKST